MSSMTPHENGTSPAEGAVSEGRAHWRSLDELADTPEFRTFVEREFPSLLPDMTASDSSRRSFLKMMGASAALAGLAGCRWPRENILPYARRPEGRLPGVPVHYATAMEMCGVGNGLLVKSVDGRPIKIEGNPDHPGSLGGSSSIQQASILTQYDPDRSRVVIEREQGRPFQRTWGQFDEFTRTHFATVRANGGRGFAVLSESTSSPSVERLKRDMLRAHPNMEWFEYEPVSRDNEWGGASLAFGRALRMHVDFRRADVVVCLDADPLYAHPNAVRHARDFASRRKGTNGDMNRLYVAESAYSVTGGTADVRLPVASSKIGALAGALARRLAAKGLGAAWPADVRRVVESWPDVTEADAFLESAVDDLLAHRGHGVVLAGAGQSPEVHAICHAVNLALGNAGPVVTYSNEGADRPTHRDALRALVRKMSGGEVETLLILGANPVHTSPGDVDFAAALDAVETVIHLGIYEDETAVRCRWHVPQAYFLEAWADVRAWDGTMSIVQPLVEPLYGGRTPLELLSATLYDVYTKSYDVVRETFAQTFGSAGFESAWRNALHDGLVRNSAATTWTPALRDGFGRVLAGVRFDGAADGMEVTFRPDMTLFDGRFANNGWLQELPDPMSTVTWDNTALVSIADADAHGIHTGDVVTLSLGGRSVDVAAYVMPGQAKGSIALSLGYGRTHAGRVGNGVGVNVNAIRSATDPTIATGASITATGRTAVLAAVQNHHAIDRIGEKGRDHRLHELVREATLDHFKEHPDFAQHVIHHPPLESLWKEHEYNGHKWGMSIDLTACIGCNACMTACQSENNIPVVGKEQTHKGREMNWIRVDRYFVGEPEDPQVAHQPVTCHHCENAPCEQVCPVAATVHDAEGLNVMVYNRCVGTRYCSNNCPYKVRRFNFFNYQQNVPDVVRMGRNPEVTVRSRGVMEKCSYCVQRIKTSTFQAKNEGRALRDGEITPACAQACPSQAITFGDLNQADSRVRKTQDDPRAYAMLAELNVKPRTKYLAKLRNPASGHSTGHAKESQHG